MSNIENNNEKNKYDLTDEYERQRIIQDTCKEIKDNTIIGAVEFNETTKRIEVDTDHKEIKAMKEYITSDIDDEHDKDIKKVASTAAYIAAQKGYLGDKMKEKNPDDVARIVDNSLTATKVAYKVATGEMDPEDVVDYTVDRTTATVGEIVSTKVEEATTTTGTAVGAAVGGTVGKKIGSAIGGAIGSVLGPVGAGVGAVVGAVAGSVVGKAVGGVIKKGVEIVGKAVKTVARAVGGVVRAIGRGIKNLVSGFLGFLGL